MFFGIFANFGKCIFYLRDSFLPHFFQHLFFFNKSMSRCLEAKNNGKNKKKTRKKRGKKLSWAKISEKSDATYVRNRWAGSLDFAIFSREDLAPESWENSTPNEPNPQHNVLRASRSAILLVTCLILRVRSSYLVCDKP